MTQDQLLSEISSLESKKDWKNIAVKYEALYSKAPTKEVAIHFAFFCWYLLWQWDEICFPGEEALTPSERRTSDTRNGISKSKLFSNLDLTTKNLLGLV